MSNIARKKGTTMPDFKVSPTTPPAGVSPVAGSLSVSGQSPNYIPVLGRPIWVRTSGGWVGTVQLMRSTDSGTTWYPITTSASGVPITRCQWTANVNAAVQEEYCDGAIYCLQATLTSGTLSYEVRQ